MTFIAKNKAFILFYAVVFTFGLIQMSIADASQVRELEVSEEVIIEHM